MKFKQIFDSFFYKNLAKESIPELWQKGEGDKPLNDSPYSRQGLTWRQHLREFHLLHYVFKYKILVPSLKLIEWLLKDQLIERIDSEKHNQYLRAIQVAWETASLDWMKFYAKPIHETMNVLKSTGLTMMFNDTAYRNFAAIWSVCLTELIQEHRKVDLEIFDKSIERAIYHWNVYCLRQHRSSQDRGHDFHSHQSVQEDAYDSNASLRTIKKLVLTLAWNEGPVLKFLNLFMARLALEVQEKIALQGEINYLFYTRNLRQASSYYKMYEKVTEIPAMKDKPKTMKVDVLVEPVNRRVLGKGRGFFEKEGWKN